MDQIPLEVNTVFDTAMYPSSYDLEDLKDVHTMFQKCYLEKENSYTMEDIYQILPVFDRLKIPEKIKKSIKTELEKNYKIRENEKILSLQQGATVNLISSSSLETKGKPKSFLPPKHKILKKSAEEKEYNTIYHELLTYFDFEHMKPIRLLTLDEIIYCMYLQLKINFKKQQVDQFLAIMNKTVNKIHPISLYVLLYQKIKFYEKELHLESSVTEIESYFQQLYIPESDEEYDDWKKIVQEEVNHLISLLPENYEYDRAYRLVKEYGNVSQ